MCHCVPDVLKVQEVMRCVPLCIFEAVEGGLYLLEVFEVLEVLEVLEASEVIHRVLLCMLRGRGG